MIPAARKPLVCSVSAGLLIALFFLQSLLSSGLKSPAWDETGDIAAGLSYIETGKFTVNPEHPPLLKELSGIFLSAAGIHWPHTAQAEQLLAGQRQLQWIVGDDIITANGPDRAMFWARLPFMLLASGMGVVLYLWGRRMLGAGAALGALFLYALDPTIVAHSYLATLDVGLAAFALLFCFALWMYLQQPTRRRMLWCGLALGGLLGAKFSGPILLPVAALLILVAIWRPPEKSKGVAHWILDIYGGSVAAPAKTGPNDPCPCGSGKKFKKCHGAEGATLPAPAGLSRRMWIGLCAFLVICAVAGFVVWGLYFFPADPFVYLHGMALVNANHTADYQAFLNGSLGTRFLSYFAVAWMLKEPLASLMLTALGLAVVLRSKTMPLLDKLFLLLPPAVIFAAHTVLADDLGVRYIIPAFPFAYLIGGVALAELVRGPALWKRAAAVAMGVWMVMAAAGIYPDHLSYFNESACLLKNPGEIGWDGGSRCGPMWLDDSNVDWGEGMKQLHTWLDKHAFGRTIHLAYFGSFPPAVYGVVYDDLNIDRAMEPPPGVNVISAHLLGRSQVWGVSWLAKIRPTAIVGHCLYVYDIKDKVSQESGVRTQESAPR